MGFINLLNLIIILGILSGIVYLCMKLIRKIKQKFNLNKKI